MVRSFICAQRKTQRVTRLAAVTSRVAEYAIPSAFGGAARDLDVPMLSQETHAGHYPEYDGGGEAWCSPTSVAMVLGFWMTPFLKTLFEDYITKNGGNPRALTAALNR